MGLPNRDVLNDEKQSDFLKTRIEDLGLSGRIIKLIEESGIRTVGGLVRKKESDLRDLAGLGEKGIEEIKRVLLDHDVTLKE